MPVVVNDVLRAPGHPLKSADREWLESRLGHDFSTARIHTDSVAADSARAVNAHAYTVGRHIVFGHGQFQPETPSGRRLLAHELAHVAQERHTPVTTAGPITIGEMGSAAETEAESLARSIDQAPVVIGRLIRRVPRSSSSQATLHRQPTRAQSKPYPKTITIGTEQVNVDSKDDEKEAKRIFDVLSKQYNIEINSARVLEALVATSKSVSATQALGTSIWEVSELQALERGLARFKAVLGPVRKFSLRGGSSQELTHVGRLKTGLNPERVWPSSNVLGEFFERSDSAAFYDVASNQPRSPLADKSKSFEGTVIHEAAHAIFPNGEARFIQEITPPYWKSDTESHCPELQAGHHYSVWERARLGGPTYCYQPPGPEPPITDYGKKSATEDLAEAVMFYFLEPGKLAQQAPQRFRITKKLVDALQPSPTPGPTP